MFDKLKQLKQLKDLKDSLEKERKEVEKEGVRVIVNGKMEVEEIKINSQLDPAKLGEVIKDCINEAIQKIQAEVAQRMFRT